MAANVESMMYAGAVPWHGEGTSVITEQTAENAMKISKLDWDVDLKSIQVAGGKGVKGWKAVVRRTDGKTLGIVGAGGEKIWYEPIQNRTGFSLMDSVVGAGKACYHTAGSLDGGRKIWILCKLPGEVVVGKGDVTEKYLLLSSTHDGSGALRMLFTPIRVVCQNTLSMALSKAGAEGISIRHFSNAESRIAEAAAAMKQANEFFGTFATEAQRMAGFGYSKAKLAELVESLFPAKHADDRKPHPFTVKNRARVEELFETGIGHETISGSAFAAYNAVTQWVDHERGAQKALPEARIDSSWFGLGAQLKRKAFAVIRQQMAGKPVLKTFEDDEKIAA